MNIEEKLASGHTKKINNEIVTYVGNNKEKFQLLLDCVLGENMRLSHRASWALGDVSLKYPELFGNYHRVLIDALKVKQSNNAIRRNIVRTYQFAEIPQEFEAELYDICLNFIADVDEAIAVRAFSIRVCERIIEKYPEMANELLTIIRSNITIWSSGLKNRGQKFLKRWDV